MKNPLEAQVLNKYISIIMVVYLTYWECICQTWIHGNIKTGDLPFFPPHLDSTVLWKGNPSGVLLWGEIHILKFLFALINFLEEIYKLLKDTDLDQSSQRVSWSSWTQVLRKDKIRTQDNLWVKDNMLNFRSFRPTWNS